VLSRPIVVIMVVLSQSGAFPGSLPAITPPRLRQYCLLDIEKGALSVAAARKDSSYNHLYLRLGLLPKLCLPIVVGR